MTKSYNTLKQESYDRGQAAYKRLQEIERVEAYDKDAFYVCICGTAGIANPSLHRQECRCAAKDASEYVNDIFVWRCHRELRFLGTGIGYSGYVPLVCDTDKPEFFIPWKEAAITAPCTRCGVLNEYDSLDPRLGTDKVHCAGRNGGTCGGIGAKGDNSTTHTGHHITLVGWNDDNNPPGFVRCYGLCDDCFGPSGKSRAALFLDFHPGFDQSKHPAHRVQLTVEIAPSRYRAICNCHRVFDVRVSDEPPDA